MADYSDIIRRLEEADGPSKDLDAEVFFAVFPQWKNCKRDDSEEAAKFIHPDFGRLAIERCTHSLDEALALVERMLPGCDIEIVRAQGHWFADLAEPELAEWTVRGAMKDTPAISLLHALFRALDKKEGS